MALTAVSVPNSRLTAGADGSAPPLRVAPAPPTTRQHIHTDPDRRRIGGRGGGGPRKKLRDDRDDGPGPGKGGAARQPAGVCRQPPCARQKRGATATEACVYRSQRGSTAELPLR